MDEDGVALTTKWYELTVKAGVSYTTKWHEAMAEAGVLFIHFFTSLGMLLCIFFQNKSIHCSFSS